MSNNNNYYYNFRRTSSLQHIHACYALSYLMCMHVCRLQRKTAHLPFPIAKQIKSFIVNAGRYFHVVFVVLLLLFSLQLDLRTCCSHLTLKTYIDINAVCSPSFMYSCLQLSFSLKYFNLSYSLPTCTFVDNPNAMRLIAFVQL